MAVIRVSRGVYPEGQEDAVAAALDFAAAPVGAAIRALPGLLHFESALDRATRTMLNVSVWARAEDAAAMGVLPEMLALRARFTEAGVAFEPIVTADILWSA
jgi:hypothetical protein